MAIILPRVEKRPEYGFLSGLAGSLSQGLAGAAQSQFEQFQQRRQMEAKRESLRKLGVPESLSEYIMNLSPAEQFEAVGQYIRGGEGQPGQEFTSNLSEQFMPQQQVPQEPQGQVANLLSALGGPQQAQGLEKLLSPQQQRQLRLQQQFGVAPQAAAPAAEVPQVQAPAIKQPTEEQKFFKAIEKGRGGKLAEVKEKKIPQAVQTNAFKAVETADQMESLAKEMRGLLDSGKVSSGILGLRPTVTQSAESQQFEALANELAGLFASRSGVATNFKIKLAQSMKPNLTQKPQTQRALIDRVEKTAKELRGNANKVLGKESESTAPSDSEFPPAQFTGRQVVDDETGAVYESNGKQWVRVR